MKLQVRGFINQSAGDRTFFFLPGHLNRVRQKYSMKVLHFDGGTLNFAKASGTR